VTYSSKLEFSSLFICFLQIFSNRKFRLKMPQYKLKYFDIRGLAEPIRLVFMQAGIPFEDVRIKFEDWPPLKEKMPFGQMPVLEVDGKQLTQSMAILRYIARKHGLEADDEWDRAVGDELATSWLDIQAQWIGAFQEPDKELKKQKFQKVIEDFVKPRLKISDERIAKSPSGFVAGNKVTWCDFVLYNILTMMKDFLKVPLSPYPHLEKFVHKIEELPKVKEWHAKHPVSSTQFSVFPSPME